MNSILIQMLLDPKSNLMEPICPTASKSYKKYKTQTAIRGISTDEKS